NTSLRLFSMSSSGRISAAASSGKVSSRMRPLVSAMVRVWLMEFTFYEPLLLRTLHAAHTGTQGLEFLFDFFVPAINVVDAVDQGFAIGNQTSNDQAGRCAQVGCHHRRGLQAFNPGHQGGVLFKL